MSFSWLQAKLAALGAVALSIFYFVVRIQMLKNQRDKAVTVSETLKARHHVVVTQSKIKREKKKELVSRKADIVKEINKAKEEFKGLDNLTNSNDF